ncbi:MAG TPA: carboxypeptidase regulatory-like domain-containing protein [Streptosporangiaceae bacterium]|nr:carboxypeptidase regulatory-like domain-containing protein [Streptosporangiaceae bacterium]
MKIHDFMTCYGEYSVHINVPIRVASAAALAAGVAIALLAAPAQAATGASAGHAASTRATASSSSKATSPTAKLPLTAAQLQADRQRQDAAQSKTTLLTGVARSATGQPLAGICVTAYGQAGEKGAVTRTDGRFTISGLQAGRYQVQYRSCDGSARQYLPEWYGDVLQRSESRTVSVQGFSLAPVQALDPVTLYPANSTLGDLPSAVVPQHGSDKVASDPFGRYATPQTSPANLMKSLAARYLPRASQAAQGGRPGKISGVVTSPGGHGLQGICVEIEGTSTFAVAVTGKNGAYSSPALPKGKYVMAFFADCGNTGNWLFQIYKDIYNPAKRPTIVTIKAGRTTKHVSVVMKEGAQISGTVTGPGGRKLSGICAYPLTNSLIGLFLFGARSSHGNYHIRSLPPGRYQIGFASCGLSNWAPTLWPDTQRYRSAPYIHIHGARNVGNVDEIMQPGGIVTGTVTAATNPPTELAGMCAVAFEDNGLGVVGTAATSATGSYEIFGLAPGRYSVQFTPGCNNNGNYVGVNYPKNITVAGGTTTSGINAALPIGAVISGQVTGAASGKPVGGICVEINGTIDGFGFPIGFEVTNAGGRYSVNQLPVGKYQVQFSGGCGNTGSYAPQGWPDTNVLEPQNINVTAAGQHVTAISAALQPGPVISGTVTNRVGHKLTGICVGVFTPSGVEFGFSQTFDGRYEAPDLAPGSYQVLFAPGCGDNEDLAEMAFRSQVSGGADTVSAISGTLSGINAVMQPAGSISGVVRTATGHSVGFSCLILTGVSGPAKSLLGEALLFGSKYDLIGLPLGGYKVTFAPDCIGSKLQNQWYKDKPTPAGATTVVVRAFSTTKEINSRLRTGGSIAGRIVADGKPVRNMCVLAQNVSVFLDFGGATSNRAGKFDIPGLNSGKYELEVEPCGTGSNSLAGQVLPQIVQVTAPRRTTGVKLTAVPGATITGTVQAGTPPTGVGAAGACVEAVADNGDAYNGTNTGLDGTFSITNLPPGEYSVYVGDVSCSFSEPNLAPQWYLGKATESTATPVSVSVGAKTTLSSAVNLVLDGSISGTVTGQHGSPVRGICVAATSAATGRIYSVTGSAGSYSISDLPAGGYKVQFSSGCGASGYKTQWYRGKSTSKTATLVSVTAGTTTSSISARLSK